MTLIVMRVEAGLKNLIQKLSKEQNRSMSEVARDLMKVGIGAQKEGGLRIIDSFGTSRSLANFQLEGEEKRLGVRINKDLEKELKDQFGEETRKSARKAIRLGSLLIKTDEIKIEGVVDVEGLSDGVESIELEGKGVREAVGRLSEKSD